MNPNSFGATMIAPPVKHLEVSHVSLAPFNRPDPINHRLLNRINRDAVRHDIMDPKKLADSFHKATPVLPDMPTRVQEGVAQWT